jgi:hypothetical protein
MNKARYRVENATLEHAADLPTSTDRPAYLEGQKYYIAVDTETTGFNWYAGERPFLATVSDYDRDWLFYLPDEKDRDVVEDGSPQLREAILNADGAKNPNQNSFVQVLASPERLAHELQTRREYAAGAVLRSLHA